MSTDRRAMQQEIEAWKRSLPVTSRGRKADAARQLRDHIRILSFGFRDWLEEAMRPQGMTVAQLRMLFVVRYETEASSARIARLCQVTPQTLQAMLQRAVREGWLLRAPAQNNARILVPQLTARGEALLEQAMDATSAFELLLWRDSSVTELQRMNAAFQKAIDRMQKSAATPPAASPAPKKRREAKSSRKALG